VRYIAKMLWPTNLAVIYPYPEDFPLWMVSAACLLIASVTYLALKHAKTRPWLLVGWLWYLGTLVPVIGLVQVGHQAMADRYTYIPSIGLFIIIAWGASQWAARWRYGKTVLTIVAVSAVCCLSLITRMQLQHWENSVTLFRNTIEVTKKNTVAHNNLGNALLEKGDAQVAVKHFATVLALNPKNAKAQNNLGNAFMKIERVDEAIGHYLESIELAPAVARTHNNLAVALYRQKRMAESIRHFLTALRLKPDYAEAYNNLGAAYRRTGQGERAARSYLKAIELRPDFAEAYNNLGILLLHQGKPKTASSYFRKALASKPDYKKAQDNLKKLEAAQEKFN
jgi:Flp pilus assembly protein TadD